MAVQFGIDLLLKERLDLITGSRVGLISNAMAVTGDLTGTVDALLRQPEVELAALFGPEHGFSGGAHDAIPVDSSTDARTGLPIHSLYGEQLKPTARMLAGIDILVFDIPEVGVRFYTYMTTLLYAMQAAAAHGLPVIVCDRPNPIGGEVVEGPILKPGFESFVGCGPLPVRHGLTIGELAQLFNTDWGVGCDLAVVPCAGWRRDMWFDETGLPWVPPSPGIPKLETAAVYPGTCFIEGTSVSEGRGTALPLEVLGAPWVDPWALADSLNDLGLAGVRFRPAFFEPTASKWADQPCGGVQVHVLDRDIFRPVTMGMHLIATIKTLYANYFAWQLPHFDHLAGT
ncbi:MAG: DUF1343 domain-containing protein, partial [Chloroflexota bacterium]|nr:DUF1343 domain-containing protein [Chloroflexota bacterium]